MQDESTPVPNGGNGQVKPPTLEDLDHRLHLLEFTHAEDMRDMRPVLIAMGGEVSRQGRLLGLVAQAVGVKPDEAGPPPDVTGALKALQAKDAEHDLKIADAAKWPARIAHALSTAVKAIPKIVVALGIVSAAIWGLKQSIDEGIVILRGWTSAPTAADSRDGGTP